MQQASFQTTQMMMRAVQRLSSKREKNQSVYIALIHVLFIFFSTFSFFTLCDLYRKQKIMRYMYMYTCVSVYYMNKYMCIAH